MSTPNNTTLEHLMKTAAGFQASCVLSAAAEWDLFTAIIKQKNSVTADTLAKHLNADQRALTVFLDALAALGFLEKNDRSCYAVPEQYRAYLDSREPTSLIPMLHHMGCCNRSWTQLAAVVKSGEFARRSPSIRGQEADYVAFIQAMNAVSRTLAEPLCYAMKEKGVFNFRNKDSNKDSSKNFRFLDVGGASGTYTLAILKLFPESQGVIFDLPVAINEAKKRFAGTEYESRVTFAPGDFYCDEMPKEIDFAWVSAIIHQHNREKSQELYKKIYRAMNPGGKIAVRDFVMDATRTQPVAGALFGINMLVNTADGMVYTFDETKADLEIAGFRDVEYAVPDQTMSAVVVARKR